MQVMIKHKETENGGVFGKSRTIGKRSSSIGMQNKFISPNKDNLSPNSYAPPSLQGSATMAASLSQNKVILP